MINHIVLFKTEENDELDIILDKEFFKLKNKIPEIISITEGNNISKEGFDKEFNKGYILQFEDEKKLQTYLVSEAHKYFVDKYVKELVEDVCIFDYKTKF